MERVHHVVYETRAQARTDIFFYIEAFYNRQRRHSTLGYVSQAAHEAAYYQHQLA
jgi:putative transposase